MLLCVPIMFTHTYVATWPEWTASYHLPRIHSLPSSISCSGNLFCALIQSKDNLGRSMAPDAIRRVKMREALTKRSGPCALAECSKHSTTACDSFQCSNAGHMT
jgi:hypothetical protein